MKNKTRNQLIFLACIVLILILLFTPLGLTLLHEIGYSSGMQGLDITWNSVHYKDYWYDSAHWGPNPNYENNIASAHTFIEPLDFDPDDMNLARPNLCGSTSYVTVDRDVAPIPYGPWRIKTGEQWIWRQNTTHKWQEKQEIYKEFEIKRFKCDWMINLWLTGSDREAYPHVYKKYQEADVWLRIKPQTFCYFVDNPDQVFFAPALLQVADVTYLYGGEEDPSVASDWQIVPQGIGEKFYIFYNKGGTEPVNMEEKVLSYQGALLDPAIFRSEYWIRFHIIELAAKSAMNPFPPGTWWYAYPSYNFRVLVYVFVVGEWTVKLFTDEIKELEPHKTNFLDSLWVLLGRWFNNILTSPWAWLITIVVFAFLAVVAIILLAIFAPGVLSAIGRTAERVVPAKKGAKT